MGTIGTRVTIILVGVGVGRVEYEHALELITEVCKGVCPSYESEERGIVLCIAPIFVPFDEASTN